MNNVSAFYITLNVIRILNNFEFKYGFKSISFSVIIGKTALINSYSSAPILIVAQLLLLYIETVSNIL